jgi:hypothetical protein
MYIPVNCVWNIVYKSIIKLWTLDQTVIYKIVDSSRAPDSGEGPSNELACQCQHNSAMKPSSMGLK